MNEEIFDGVLVTQSRRRARKGPPSGYEMNIRMENLKSFSYKNIPVNLVAAAIVVVAWRIMVNEPVAEFVVVGSLSGEKYLPLY